MALCHVYHLICHCELHHHNSEHPLIVIESSIPSILEGTGNLFLDNRLHRCGPGGIVASAARIPSGRIRFAEYTLQNAIS